MKSFTLLFSSILNLSFISENFLPEFAIEQNGKIISLETIQTEIHLEKKSFSISFNAKEYDAEKIKFFATQIAVSKDKSDLDEIKPGVLLFDLDYLSPGTGNATTGPYEFFSLTSNDGGHQYITYEKNGEQRAELISEKDGVMRLKCEVEKISDDGKIFPLPKLKLDSLYLILFSDANLNEQLDSGEYRTVMIVFYK